MSKISEIQIANENLKSEAKEWNSFTAWNVSFFTLQTVAIVRSRLTSSKKRDHWKAFVLVSHLGRFNVFKSTLLWDGHSYLDFMKSDTVDIRTISTVIFFLFLQRWFITNNYFPSRSASHTHTHTPSHPHLLFGFIQENNNYMFYFHLLFVYSHRPASDDGTDDDFIWHWIH